VAAKLKQYCLMLATAIEFIYIVEIIQIAVKIASLLTQYLYTNHRLDLPGIGSFLMDPSGSPVTESSKHKSAVPDGVSFVSNPSLKDAPQLVAFISSQTGKMKALANADLESHIELIQQFLNIGKPYEFDGIGTLVKKKAGVYEFIPFSTPAEKLKEYKQRETAVPNAKAPKSVTLEEAAKDYDSFLALPKSAFGWRRPVMALLVLCGIALAIWGGYTISRNAAADDATQVLPPVANTAPPPVDSTAIKAEMERNRNYKYIIQVAKKQQAMNRYKQFQQTVLKDNIEMETSDSIQYKLFVKIPATYTDTTHVIDSLSAFTGRKVYIEHDN
jgi:hypothetical protein